MDKKRDDDLTRRLKEVFSSILPPEIPEKYPDKALPVGTFARPARHNKLGVIIDAFYGELDADNQKIIIYTILMLPQVDPVTRTHKRNDQYYLTNEYEYEITAYLMIAPADISKLTAELGGGLFL